MNHFLATSAASSYVTCFLVGQCYASLLEYSIIHALQTHMCVKLIDFMQNEDPSHLIDTWNKCSEVTFLMLWISGLFPTSWLAIKPDLNPCDFWIWGYRNIIVYRNPIRSLSDLRKSIELCNFSMCQCYVHSIPTHILQFIWLNMHKSTCYAMNPDGSRKSVYHFEHVLSSLDGKIM